MEVKLSGVSKHYATVTAVNNLSFEVHNGEIFALLGPNGAGKSSTIRMLIGLTEADNGEICYSQDSTPLPSISNDQFGYLPEERGLFQEKPILDTLVYLGQLKGMSKKQASEEATHWLSLFELSERKLDLLKTLSKGNQQKVQLISAVLHKPDIVFLDEPFSGLDPYNQEKVIEFLRKLQQQGMTIVLSAHQMSLVEKLADRFLLLNQGKAQMYGTLAQIRQQSALGDSLHLTFKQPVELAAIFELPGITSGEQTGPDAVTLQLTTDCDLPSLLAGIMQRWPVANLQTERPGLHEIYLTYVQKDGNSQGDAA